MKKALRAITIVFIVLVGCVCLWFGVGYLNTVYISTISKETTNAIRENFQETTVYNEGVIDDLSKYYFEFQNTDDDVEKGAIAQLVNNRFGNYDIDKINNPELKTFLSNCRNGNY